MERLIRICGSSRVLAWLIMVNVAVSVLLFGAMGIDRLMHSPSGWINSWLALPSSPAVFIRHPWTLLTYMVTQESLLHLIFNMLWLLWFGRIFLYASDDRRLLSCYTGGGVTGAAFYLLASIFTPGAGGALIGSSAAVLSVMAVAAMQSPDLRMNLMLIGEVKLKWVAIVCILITLAGAGGSRGTQAAHIGGLAFGLGYILALRRGLRIPSFSQIREGMSMPRITMGRNKTIRTRNPEAAASAMAGRLCDHQRLDQLLDRIRISGYDSLSPTEKRELDAISRRL